MSNYIIFSVITPMKSVDIFILLIVDTQSNDIGIKLMSQILFLDNVLPI